MSGDEDPRRALWQNALGRLTSQYAAALNQYTNSPDSVVRVQAAQQMEEIERQWETMQQKLNDLALRPPAAEGAHSARRDPRRVHDQLRQRICEIDFGDLDDWLRRFLRTQGAAGQGRAALLMLRRCAEMSGSLCTERIREILKSHTDPGLFDHRQLGFERLVTNAPAAILEKLCGAFGMGPLARALDHQVRAVTGRLCESLQPGSVVLLEIGGCDWLIRQDPAFIQWFVSAFWPQLLRDLDAAVADLGEGLIVLAVLSFDGALPAAALPCDHCCSTDDFRRDRLLEIPLKHWERHEVQEWLVRWGLPGRQWSEQLELLDFIMSVTEGVPDRTANELLKRCAKTLERDASCQCPCDDPRTRP